MSYTVLARKWRPQRFEDVIGQAHVSRSLMNALGMGRVAHAFLFSGTRGVGKTTTARILAKALNCEKGPAPSPCCQCSACNEIAQGTSVDVIEIDGASNTGVDNVRELRENVKYAPAKSRYKVYIIDEVHMLSTAAFNALLKTLEEPPAHVVFIFATTDPHKLPATILSRCQHYDFRRVPRDIIKSHLRSLCDKENINVEDKALERIAMLAEGSVRDSLSLLDQVLSYSGSEGIKDSDLDNVLGLVGRESVKTAARAIISQNAADALGIVDSLVDTGHDLRRFTSELLAFFRDLMVVKIPDYPERSLGLADAEVAELKDIAAGLVMEETIRVMNIITRLADELKWSPNPRISLELALIKAASRPINTIEEILAGIKSGKDVSYGTTPPVRSMPAPAARTAAPSPTGYVREAAKPSSAPAARPGRPVREETYYSQQQEPPQVTGGDSAAIEVWNTVLKTIRLLDSNSPIISKIALCIPLGEKDGKFEVNETHILKLKDEERQLIEQTLADISGHPVSLNSVSSEKVKNKKTLDDHKKEKEVTHLEKLRKEVMDEPIVRATLDIFGGELETVESVKA